MRGWWMRGPWVAALAGAGAAWAVWAVGEEEIPRAVPVHPAGVQARGGVRGAPDPFVISTRGVFIPPAVEAQLGESAFGEMRRKGRVSRDAGKKEAVERVAKRVLAAAGPEAGKWEWVVFEDSSPNAFALPGGKIGVNTGIFPVTRNDAGLAAVLGHEIAHVTLRHGAKRMQTQLGVAAVALAAQSMARDRPAREQQMLMSALGVGSAVGVTLPFGRNHELEADRLGLLYMARAGYEPGEAVAFWERMRAEGKKQGKPPEWLSTHPADDRRIAQMRELLPEVRARVAAGAPGE